MYESTFYVLSLKEFNFSSSKYPLLLFYEETIDCFQDSNDDHFKLIDCFTSSKLCHSSLIIFSVFHSYPSLIGEDYIEIGLLFLSIDFYH